MIKVAIVDDEQEEIDRLKNCICIFSKNNNIEFEITQYNSSLEFLEVYKPIYDIIFLDIMMPGINGMNVAREIRKFDKTCNIIFVTNCIQYAVEGYSVDALDFFVKPIEQKSLDMKLQRAVSRIVDNKEKTIQIKDGSDIRMIYIKEILYIEVQGHYVIYHTKTDSYQEYSTLKSVEEKLDSKMFAKCNRCYLVNLSYISGITHDTACIGGNELVISRNQRKTFLDSFSNYIGGVAR